MRAVGAWVVLLLSCGGRTLDDGSYDVGFDGEAGSGATSSGASGGGPASGGAPSTGASTGRGGGSSGGAPSGKGGAAASGGVSTGGATGTGGSAGGSAGAGAKSGSSDCATFCRNVSAACASGMRDTLSCIDACDAELRSLAPPCREARRGVVACMGEIFGRFPMQCHHAQEQAFRACESVIRIAETCGQQCSGGISIEANRCELFQSCPGAEYHMTCFAETSGGVTCECARNGTPWGTISDATLSVASACSTPDAVTFCGIP